MYIPKIFALHNAKPSRMAEDIMRIVKANIPWCDPLPCSIFFTSTYKA